MKLPRKQQMYGWWYGCIALGFVLLAIQRYLWGEKRSLIALRLVIAAGFGILCWLQFYRTDRR